MKKQNVLFLCTGNSCRSIMSEAILRDRYGDRFDAYSAGTEPKGVHPMTLQVLEEIGIDTSGLSSKSVKEYLGRLWVHYLIIVCQDSDSCPRIFPGMIERMSWTFDDPPAYDGPDKLNKFRQVRDEIGGAIDSWVQSLEATSAANSVKGGQVG